MSFFTAAARQDRRAGRGGSAAAAASPGPGARGAVEDELLGLTEHMKTAASSFGSSLQADNARLEAMSSQQERHLGSVKGELERGKKQKRNMQLGFCMTVLMVVASIIIFFSMVPFILMTR